MPDKLEILIQALEKVNYNPENMILGAFISILKEIAADPEKKARVNKDDDTLAGYIITYVAYSDEEILDTPKIQDLIKFASELKPTDITNVLDSTWNMDITKPAHQHPPAIKSHKHMQKNR